MAILVGTASWTDKTLLDCGRFYPKDANTAEARLRYYSSLYPVVEVDSSYYAIPRKRTRVCGSSERRRASRST